MADYHGARPTLVSGAAGCGKTMFAMEFIVHGAVEFNEPGVFVTFEENVSDLKKNFATLGYDLDKLINEKKLVIDRVFLDRSLIMETGEYDLDALFIRLGYAIDSIGAKRISLDTIEVLFSGLSNHALLRSELVRLFRWLKDRGITTIVTGERGEQQPTRYGLEEYIADCVIFLDSRVMDQIVTRRLRIVKYRGSLHDMDEFPFLINKDGIIFPISSIKTDYKLSREHISTGIAQMDVMLDGKGFWHSSSVLYTGTAGTGKTSFAAHFVDAACQRGEKCLYMAFEETEDQIVRNMKSIGIDPGQWVKKGMLKFYITRPALYGLEMHIVLIEDLLNKFQPQNVVMDPISDFIAVGGGKEVKSMLTRLQDLMKSRGMTTVYTDLLVGDISAPGRSEAYISSMIDTWILLRNIEYNGERSRGLTIIKSRGMPHSNQIREFVFSSEGIDLIPPYIGPAGVFMGSAKVIQEAKDKA
jgi:circadian clock protein KaiC